MRVSAAMRWLQLNAIALSSASTKDLVVMKGIRPLTNFILKIRFGLNDRSSMCPSKVLLSIRDVIFLECSSRVWNLLTTPVARNEQFCSTEFRFFNLLHNIHNACYISLVLYMSMLSFYSLIALNCSNFSYIIFFLCIMIMTWIIHDCK